MLGFWEMQSENSQPLVRIRSDRNTHALGGRLGRYGHGGKPLSGIYVAGQCVPAHNHLLDAHQKREPVPTHRCVWGCTEQLGLGQPRAANNTKGLRGRMKTP